MTELFKAGFETGDFSEFNKGTQQIGGVADVVSIAPCQGNYHGRFTLNGGDGWERAVAYHYLGTPSNIELYAGAYVKIIAHDGYFLVLDDSGQRIAWLGINPQGKWRIMLFNGVNYITKTSNKTAELNKCYWIVLYIKRDSVNGEVKAYVDGELIASLTGQDVRAINEYYLVFAGVESSEAHLPSEVDVDAVIVADQYPQPPTPKIFINFNSTPILVDATIASVTVPSGGTVQIDAGATINISAPPSAQSYYFNHWLINDAEYTANPLRLETVITDLNVVAVYTEEKPPPRKIPWIPIALGIAAIITVGIAIYLKKK